LWAKSHFYERFSICNRYTLYAGTIDLAGNWPGTAYVYHFSERKPWDIPNKDEATHILHVAFLVQTCNECLSDAQPVTAEAIVWPFITFVDGEKAHGRYNAILGEPIVNRPPVGQA
jgi:hypothetical protein